MACAQTLCDVAILIIESGLYASEIPDLKRDDIALEQDYLQIQEEKTKNTRRNLPLSIESRKVSGYSLQTISRWTELY